MATSPADTFSQELDAIAARWESQFSGQSRATRNLDELDAIVKDTSSLVARIKKFPAAAAPKQFTDLLRIAEENLTLYKNERALIVQAKNAPPEADAFAPLATAANLAFARYHRHFAGQSRATRDHALLAELLADLEDTAERMDAINEKAKVDAFAKDLALVRQTIGMYETEMGALAEAVKTGTNDERSSALAQRANNQFKLYQDHFAGQSRTTRRPALLQRMIEELTSIQDEMRALADAGFVDTNNTNNIGIVERQIAMYQNELGEIRKARKGAALTDLMGLLGGTANEVMSAYQKSFAGQDRKSRDLALLTKICDQLGEIRRQMLDLGRAEQNDMNEKNLEIVTDQLSQFEREYELIEQAKK